MKDEGGGPIRVFGSTGHAQPVASGEIATRERRPSTASRDAVLAEGTASLDPEPPQPASSAAASPTEDAIATIRTT